MPWSTKPRSDAVEPAEKKSANEETAARVSSANPGVVSAPPKRLEERTTRTPEGSRVERRADANNSGAKSVECLSLPITVNGSRPHLRPQQRKPRNQQVATKRRFNFYAGREQFSMGNVPAAIQAYQKALRNEPDFADVHLSLGHTYMR